jgi:uncharacterized protein (TIGR00288 family)
MTNNKKIALLIDCDNVSHSSIKGVIEELTKYGTVNVRHAHGNWNSPRLSKWIKKLHTYAIKPMQQFAYTTGKNATDLAIAIDAMDLLHSENIDAFALMSSDSDFTPLALRIFESGRPVYGFGAKKTPKPFVNACTRFFYLEDFTCEDEKITNAPRQKEKTTSTPRQEKHSRERLRGNTALVKLLREAVEQVSEDDDWAFFNKVGSYLSRNGSFSPPNYGYKKLGELITAIDLFEIKWGDNKTTKYIKNIQD